MPSRHLRTDGDNLPQNYDVFLSHNSDDRETVEQIALRLEQQGIVPFLDRWCLIPGDPWQEDIERVLEACKTCAVFLGPSGLSAWANEEMRVALDRRAQDSSFRVIPVLLPGAPEDADLPAFLRRLTWVDFRSGFDSSGTFDRLVAGIEGRFPRDRPPLSGEQALLSLLKGIIHVLPPSCPRWNPTSRKKGGSHASSKPMKKT